MKRPEFRTATGEFFYCSARALQLVSREVVSKWQACQSVMKITKKARLWRARHFAWIIWLPCRVRDGARAPFNRTWAPGREFRNEPDLNSTPRGTNIPILCPLWHFKLISGKLSNYYTNSNTIRCNNLLLFHH